MAPRKRSRIASMRRLSATPARVRSFSTCSLFRSTRRTSRSAAAITGCARHCRRHPAPKASAGSLPSAPASRDVKPGDLVINMQRENWAQRRRVKAEDAMPIPPGLDLAQAAMLRINPPTALLLLEDHVALKPGDWVIQNVANSAVGRHVIVLAKARGVRTVNVVRRDDVAGELRDLGADVVVKDGPDLAERARAADRRSADPARHRRRFRRGLHSDRRLRRRWRRRGELWLDVGRGPGR